MASFEKVVVRITSPDCFDGVRGEPLQIKGGPGIKVPEAPQDAAFFLQAMMNRMGISYHKYGTVHENFPKRKSGITNALQRIDKYMEDGNTEWLVDAANYMLIEFLAPGHPDAHWRATDSDESPGSVLHDGSIDHGKASEEQRFKQERQGEWRGDNPY